MCSRLYGTIVMKFGGTSVADSWIRIRVVASTCETPRWNAATRGRASSAMSGKDQRGGRLDPRGPPMH